MWGMVPGCRYRSWIANHEFCSGDQGLFNPKTQVSPPSRRAFVNYWVGFDPEHQGSGLDTSRPLG
jgi:hypothetical protein